LGSWRYTIVDEVTADREAYLLYDSGKWEVTMGSHAQTAHKTQHVRIQIRDIAIQDLLIIQIWQPLE